MQCFQQQFYLSRVEREGGKVFYFSTSHRMKKYSGNTIGRESIIRKKFSLTRFGDKSRIKSMIYLHVVILSHHQNPRESGCLDGKEMCSFFFVKGE
jgi:hypothetical protein